MKRIALAIVGQSNEQGAARNSSGNVRVGFRSDRSGQADPLQPKGLSQASGAQGSPWPMVVDALWRHGIRLHIVQTAVGSSGAIRDWCGQVFGYSSSAVYYLNDVVAPSAPNGRIYRVTTSPNTKTASAFFVQMTGSTVAGVEPGTWNTAGGTSTSGGGLVFTDLGASTRVAGNVLGSTDLYWDSLSLCADVKTQLDALSGFDEKWVYIAFGQNDAGDSAARFQSAMQNMTAYFLAQGYRVILGMSCLQVAPDKTSEYNTLNTGLQSALATYAGNANVKAGPNLFTQFGASLPFWLESDNTTRVHLTDRGQEIAASYISGVLSQIFV